jgi:hypothetical protein
MLGNTPPIIQPFDFTGNWSNSLSQMIRGATDASAAIGRIESAFSMVNRVAIGGALAFGVDQIVGVNKALEDTKYQLSGSLGAAGFATEFKDNMLLAENSMRQIREEAAKLPGTDQDFLAAFAVDMPALKEAGMTNLKEMISLSDNLVAVAKSQGIDSQQAGRDIIHMAQGHAASDVRTFMTLKASMGVTSQEEFNKLSGKERIKKLQKAVQAYSGLLDNFGDTWEALSSTAESYAKNFIVAATGPGFAAMKQGLKKVEDLYGQYQDKILLIAEYVGSRLVEIATTMGAKLAAGLGMKNVRGGNGELFNPSVNGPFLPSSAIEGYGPPAWLAQSSTIGPSADLAMKFDPTNDTMTMLTGTAAVLGAVFEDLVPYVNATKEAAYSFGALVMGFLNPIIPPLTLALGGVVRIFEELWSGAMAIVRVLSESLSPIFRMLGDVLGTAFRMLASGLYGLAMIFREAGAQISRWLHLNNGSDSTLEAAAKALHEVLGKFDQRLDTGMQAWGDNTGGLPWTAMVEENKRQYAFDMMKRAKEEQDKMRAEELAKETKKAKPQVKVDNHFTIQQKFAEGFDPDRVYAAFRQDAQQQAARKLDSGLVPLYVPL